MARNSTSEVIDCQGVKLSSTWTTQIRTLINDKRSVIFLPLTATNTTTHKRKEKIKEEQGEKKRCCQLR